ncbi:MAG: tetratricopeptide repeat protein [Anaerolineae bacterium]|nr:tetratricopeptide repeat protein [Anaerolineae bacterium]
MQIEKSVFISYRRTNSYHARSIFQDLRQNGYDVFMDYESIDSGAFDQIIINQIKARAHFIVLLTPSALERCTDPNDWLRREIETAIDEKRNIVPVMMDGFNWNNMRQYLVGKMTVLDTYNALDVPANYFDEAMNRLRVRFLNIPIEAVLHPTPKADESAVKQKIADVPYVPTLDTKLLKANEHFEKGNQYYSNGQYDEAIPEYTESLKLNPHNPTAYYRRGIAYEQTGQADLASADYDRAISEADELIRQNPQDAEVYRARGSAYQFGKKEYDRAIANFDEAIRLNPQDADAYYYRGLAYYYTGEYDRAIADYTEAIRLNPQDAVAYSNRGFAYMDGKKDYDRAIADYDRALEINPNDESVKDNRELALREKWGG